MAHLGNNGALLGPRRISTVNNASGLWSLDEHKIAKLAGIWPATTGSGFRYYRFTEVASNGNIYIVIGELQLRGAGDVILQGTYTTDMNEVGGSVTFLDDSNVNTAVAIPYPNSNPSNYIQVDLGIAQEVNGFRQSCLESLDKQIKTFKFSGSNNGTDWTVISPLVTMPDLPAIATLDATTVPLPNIGPDPVDPYWDNVSLLLKMEDANGETSFTDSSVNALTMTSTAVVTTTQYRFGTRSADFQSGSKVIESPASSLFNLPGDFTIEMWARWSTNPNFSYKTLFTLGTYVDGILFRDDGLYVNGDQIYSDIGLDNDNDWHHYAISRSGSSLKAFKDGTAFVTVTKGGTLNSASGSLQLGRSQHATGSEYWVGQIDEVRITKGICRYTANFTPPTAPFPSIGPTPVNPIPALAPVLWYDFADEATVTTSGTEITAVTSKGSRDWTLTKSTTGPQYVTGINGKKCLDWGASPSHPNFMYNSDTTSTTIGEVYVVVDASFGGYAGNYAGLFTSYSNDWYVLVYASSIAESGTGFNQLFVNGGTASLYSSGLFASPSIDNPAIVRIKNSSGTPFNTTGGFEIGNDRGNSSLNRGWCGLIGEYIVFPSALNSTDRATVENYLSEKWGISLAA